MCVGGWYWWNLYGLDGAAATAAAAHSQVPLIDSPDWANENTEFHLCVSVCGSVKFGQWYVCSSNVTVLTV